MSARHQTHPSPQPTPVIFQAGASKDGIEFAGKHAEALYCGSLLLASTATYVKSVPAEAVGMDETLIDQILCRNLPNYWTYTGRS